MLCRYIDAYIVPEDRERIRKATGLDVLLKQVLEIGLHKLEYRRNMNGVYSYYEMNAKPLDLKMLAKTLNKWILG